MVFKGKLLLPCRLRESSVLVAEGRSAVLTVFLLVALASIQGCASKPEMPLVIDSAADLRYALETRNWREGEAAVSQLREQFRPELVSPLLRLWEESDRSEVQRRCFRILDHWGIPVVKHEYLEHLRQELSSWNSQVQAFARENQQDRQWLSRVSKHLRGFAAPLKTMDNFSSPNMRVIRDRALAEVHRAIWIVDQGDLSQTKGALQQLHSTIQAEMLLLGGMTEEETQSHSSANTTPGQPSIQGAAQSPE